VMGSPEAPYLNSLAAQYGLATQVYAITHPRLPNYLALTGGDTFGVTTDCNDCFQDAPSIADSVEQAGLSWKAYMESMPSPCYVGDAKSYALHHNPFLYYDNIRTNADRCSSHVVPLTDLSTDLSTGSLPDFVWITPNLMNDMHDGPISAGDAWAAQWVPQLIASLRWQNNGLLLITWDEGNGSDSCCDVAFGGHISALEIRPVGARGTSQMQATDYNLLRTMTDALGVQPVGHAADPGVQPLGGFSGG
jgi:phospholipase C